MLIPIPMFNLQQSRKAIQCSSSVTIRREREIHPTDLIHTSLSSNIGTDRSVFLWWSVVECGGVWWSVVECGGWSWIVVEGAGLWWSEGK